MLVCLVLVCQFVPSLFLSLSKSNSQENPASPVDSRRAREGFLMEKGDSWDLGLEGRSPWFPPCWSLSAEYPHSGNKDIPSFSKLWSVIWRIPETSVMGALLPSQSLGWWTAGQGSASLNWGTNAPTDPNPLKYYQRKRTGAKSCLIHLSGVANTVFSIVILLLAALPYKPKPYHKFLLSYHECFYFTLISRAAPLYGILAKQTTH